MMNELLDPKLAINGGSPIRVKPRPLTHVTSEQDRQQLLDALRSEKWTNGSQVRIFENMFAEYVGSRNALLVSSGTAAIEIALLAAGIGEGDEVILPGITFPSVAIAVMRCGAIPVPADISRDTYAVTKKTVSAVETENTRAVIPTHLFCSQADMIEICHWAKQRNITVIEDAAQALGSQRYGKKCGSFGDIGIFSFNERKILSCGDGGCLVTDDDELFQKSKYLREVDQYIDTQPDYLQFTYRVTEFQAAILISQLTRIAQKISLIEKNGESLREFVDSVPGVKTLEKIDGTDVQSFYNFCFTIRGFSHVDWFRSALAAELQAEVSGCYLPLSETLCVRARDPRHAKLFLKLLNSYDNCCDAHYRESVRFSHFMLSDDHASLQEIILALEKLFKVYQKACLYK